MLVQGIVVQNELVVVSAKELLDVLHLLEVVLVLLKVLDSAHATCHHPHLGEVDKVRLGDHVGIPVLDEEQITQVYPCLRRNSPTCLLPRYGRAGLFCLSRISL